MADWHDTPEWRKARAYAKKHLDPICVTCGKELEGWDWTIDHILPPSKTGGVPDHSLNNLQSMCRSCNGRKQDSPLKRIPWTNPRFVPPE